MTIHHDKLAYGRLKSLNEEMSADEISKLVEEINGEEEDAETKAEKSNNKKEDKSG